MKMMDCVEVTVEKEKYAREGIHKGMQGWICLDDNTFGTWLVNFPQCGEKEDIAEISVKEEDLKVIAVMNVAVNEQIKARFDNTEKMANSRIIPYLTDKGIKPDYYLLTHFHGDHDGMKDEILKIYSIKAPDGKKCEKLLKKDKKKRYAYLIPRVMDAYLAIYDESRGIERVEAVTAIPLTEAQLSALSLRLEEKTGKKIVITNTVDKAILGGMKLRYMGIQLDGTVKSRLDSFEKSLKSLIV